MALEAKLAYLTNPLPGHFTLNIQDEDEDFRQFAISRDQLAGLVADGARALALAPVTRDGEL